jgi:hypothetical protein
MAKVETFGQIPNFYCVVGLAANLGTVSIFSIHISQYIRQHDRQNRLFSVVESHPLCLEDTCLRAEDLLIIMRGLVLNVIDRADIEHRDRVLRAYFEGRNWDGNNEYALKRKLVMNSLELLPDYPFVIDDEWEVKPSRGDQGKGDLIFTNGEGRFAVVEVKWIDLERRGKTVRTGRNKDRKKVKEQAARYRDILAEKLGPDFHVEGYYFTNNEADDVTQPSRI